MSLFFSVNQRMQQSQQQQQDELQALQDELQTLKRQTEKEKEEQGRQDQEVLALLTQQAEQREESARQLAVKLQEKVSIQRYSHNVWNTQSIEVVAKKGFFNLVEYKPWKNDFCKREFQENPQTSPWLILHANEFSHWWWCLVWSHGFMQIEFKGSSAGFFLVQ